VGIVGAILLLIGLIRPMVDTRFTLVPGGLLLLYLGLEYVLLSVGICSDNQLVVMTRRELAAFFYSPIAYIVLLGLTVVGWFQFVLFANLVVQASDGMGGGTLLEPILQHYILHIFPVVCVIVAV